MSKIIDGREVREETDLFERHGQSTRFNRGGLTRQLAFGNPVTTKNTVTAMTDTATISVAGLTGGVIRGVPTAAANYTLPTVAVLLAGLPDAADGDTFQLVISNKSGGANTITVATATGWTLEGTVTVAQNVARLFVIVITSVASATATIHGC